MKPVFELDVYQLAEQLADMIWNDFNKWDTKVKNTVGYQIIKASDSISANIAEGYGSFTPADRKQFYRYARGSFEETKAWLRKLIKRKVINGVRQDEYRQLIDELGPKLNAFINATCTEKASKN